MPPAPPPAMHPMDPRRGENLSPMFAAFLCWLLGVQPMTSPAITGIAVCGNSVLAATTHDPLFDAHLGSLEGNSSATCAAGARPAASIPTWSTRWWPHSGGPGNDPLRCARP